MLYEKTLDGVYLQRYYGLDKILEIPGTAKGIPVTELVGYLSSDTVRRHESPPCEYRGESKLCGSWVEEIILPDTVRKVGAYSSHNYYGLNRLSCNSAVEDWGAGVFTGCTGLKCLDICIAKGRKSYFRDILSELHQTLSVNHKFSSGVLLTKFILLELFEESVKSILARVTMREMHGYGHICRYCSDGGDFCFDKYDRSFPHVEIQERPELAVRLTLYRLYWPYGLRKDAEDEYQDYVRVRTGEGTKELIEWRERDILDSMARLARLGDTRIKKVIDASVRSDDTQPSALLLSVKRSHLRAVGRNGWGEADLRDGGKQTFELQKQEPLQLKSVKHQTIGIKYIGRIIMVKRAEGQELQEQFIQTFPHIGKDKPKQAEKVFKYCEDYRKFLDMGRTERERVKGTVRVFKRTDRKPFGSREPYEPGDKVCYVNHGKSLTTTTFRKKFLDQSLRINGAHINSSGLDLKPNPLYRKEDIAFSKTHYYGDIRKYQWGTIPLAMYGVVVKRDGKAVEFSIREDEKEPVSYVTGPLPYLAARQNRRPLKDGSKGEGLNIVVSSPPFQDEEVEEPIRLLTLSPLNKKYGITEKDLLRTEVEMVPTVKARDTDFDTSIIGAYGQDDRACAYMTPTAEIGAKKSAHTTMTVLVDKEEIGPAGNMGLNSDFMFYYIEDLAERAGVSLREVIRKSLRLPSGVDAASDPSLPDVYEGRNTGYTSKGCVLAEYTGTRGEFGSNDASAEIVARVIAIVGEEGVYRQAGELGAADVGGSDTITQLVAHMDVDTVDLDVSILPMYSSSGLASKLGIYNTHKVFEALYKWSADDCLNLHEIGRKSFFSRIGIIQLCTAYAIWG